MSETRNRGAEEWSVRLSVQERAIVGAPSDWAWDEATHLPARARPRMAQFSIRVPRPLVARLRARAARDNRTFSDTVRAALEASLVSARGAEPR